MGEDGQVRTKEDGLRSGIYCAGLSSVAGVRGRRDYRVQHVSRGAAAPGDCPAYTGSWDGGGEAEQHLQRGDELLDQGDTSGAVAELFAAHSSCEPGYSEAFNNRAFVEWHAGDNAAALADFSEAIRLRPDYVNALTNRAFVYFDENDFVHSVSDASRAIELDPGMIPPL